MMEYVSVKRGERKRIRLWCLVRVCFENETMVKIFCYQNRVPAICTMRGAESCSGILSSHLESAAHKESVEASRLRLPSTAQKGETIPLYQVSNTQQKRFADRT